MNRNQAHLKVPPRSTPPTDFPDFYIDPEPLSWHDLGPVLRDLPVAVLMVVALGAFFWLMAALLAPFVS